MVMTSSELEMGLALIPLVGGLDPCSEEFLYKLTSSLGREACKVYEVCASVQMEGSAF